MPATLYLKAASSLALSSLVYVRKFLFFGSLITFASSLLLHFSLVASHLSVRLSDTETKWFPRRFEGRMTPPSLFKDSADADHYAQKSIHVPRNASPANNHQEQRRQFAPLVVAFVGLPARGKTVTAHKLERYLVWTGTRAQVFSVSDYRRKHVELYNSHDLFRADNEEACKIRKQSAQEAMEDASKWLKSVGDIAILDGPHATTQMQQNVYDYFVKQMGYKVLFVESICDDEKIIESNIKEILKLSDDYKHMGQEKAIDDLRHKIEHYMEQYDPISPKNETTFSYIKLFNSGENISVHRLDGPYQSKVLSFLSNFKPEPKTLYFSRHGESENNVLGRIGGDAELSARGQKYAASLAKYINDIAIPNLHIWTSEKMRTKQTVQGIVAPVEHMAALNELDAGVCEGLSYEEMQEQFPQEFAWRDQDKLRYRYPWGESYVDIMTRLEPVLLQLECEDNVLVVSHQAVLRCALGYFLNKKLDELPYINVPLHTVIKLTTEGYKCRMEFIKLNVECVDTYRKQPKDCSVTRSPDDALLTVPSHFENLRLWSQAEQPLIQQL